ncbi:unnamed protein product [Cuscuta epithymum]|uniref:TTF-type domain-containing protein n=1 Tax=Cuscuta epithymum TaxID=186058 RepID=A0AAV0D2X6_9ASTE|nr:unnamed protein product [Cuscuta epithymum]CAH9124750.1 unnamed protein product [Cuscuta epithymum]
MLRYYPVVPPKPKQPSIDVSSSNNLVSSSENVIPNNETNVKKARIEVELSDDDIVGDPGLRKPIETYDVNIRDKLRRRYLTKGPCQPRDFKFPQSDFNGRNRSFQKQWFDEFNWLEYSVAKDAAFNHLCYLFGRHHKNGDDAFTEVGFNNWRKAKEKFRDHEGTPESMHHYAKIKWSGFQNQKQNVDYVLSQQTKKDELEYRLRLTTIVDVVRFLLEGGLAFRGHNESATSTHSGNFLELLKWECRRHPHINMVMNSNAPGNSLLTSPKIQKEVINACATEVRLAIINEVGSKFFSLLIDEARDSSIKEQMSVVIRFVNNCGEVIERFLGVVHVSNTCAQTLKNAIDDFFAKYGLSLSKVRGQGYDGASNMSGAINGLKQKILEENKQAHYVHCFAHRLQLVIVSSLKSNGIIGSFFDHLLMIVNVVGASCKRKDDLLQKHYEDLVGRIERGEVSTGKGKNQEKSLARPGDTRWGSHYKTIIRVVDMWDAVIEVLEAIFDDGVDLKRRVKRQKTVDGSPKTYLHYFHVDIFLEVIDRLTQEMNNRFTETSSELLMCIASLSPKDSFSNFDVKRLLRLAELYPDDFSSRDKFELNEQLRVFITFVKSSPQFLGLQTIGDLAKTLVGTEWHTTYKLVYRLIQLALVLPVTTATVERSFSTMKYIKNDLRNKIGEEYLTDCLVCYIEKDIFVKIDNEVIMRRFQSMAPRRQRLPPLNDSPSVDASCSNQN